MLEKSGGAPGRTKIISPQQWLEVVQPTLTADGIPPRPVLPLSNYLAPPDGNPTRPTTMPLEGMMDCETITDPLDWGYADFAAKARQSAIDRYGLPVVEALGAMPWGDLGNIALERFQRREGIVYFVGGESGPIKIGFTTRPLCRLASMQMGSPVLLRFHACALGGLAVEREYHKRFAAHRLHGEWFERCPEIEAEITRLTNTSEVSHG